MSRAILFILAFFSFGLSAQEVSVTATVDRNEMRPGDTFTYEITVAADSSSSDVSPRLPDFSAFEIVSQWQNTEFRGTFTGGRIESKKVIHHKFLLSAKTEGQFTIGAAEVEINGQRMRTNPVKINVSTNAQAQAPPQDDNSLPSDVDDIQDQIFSQLLRRGLNPRGRSGGRIIQPVNPKEAFFIHVEIDKNKVYQGEQIVASWYLVTKAQIADIDTLKYPSLTGFWKEDIEVATRLSFQPEIINGVPYQKARLASYALFPIKDGKATIDPYEAKCRVISANMIGMPQEAYVTKKSEELTVEVLPLPAEGKTDRFTGGVGEFTVSAQVDLQKLKANTPLTLKVRIEGKGNAKLVDLPKIVFPDGIQAYDTKSEMKFFPNGRSYKEFETILVPRSSGQFVIPSLDFSFFSPEKKEYYTRTTAELTIDVEPGEGGDVIPSEKLQSKEKTAPTLTLPPPVLAREESTSYSIFHLLMAWGIWFLVSILGIVLFGYKKLAYREKREDILRKVKRRIAEIDGHVQKGDWRAAGRECTNLVYAVIGEIAGLGGASYEFSKLVEEAPPSFRREVAPSLRILMSKLEIVGFAPENLVGNLKDKKELQKLLNETEKLLIDSAKYDFSTPEQKV